LRLLTGGCCGLVQSSSSSPAILSSVCCRALQGGDRRQARAWRRNSYKPCGCLSLTARRRGFGRRNLLLPLCGSPSFAREARLTRAPIRRQPPPGRRNGLHPSPRLYPSPAPLPKGGWPPKAVGGFPPNSASALKLCSRIAWSMTRIYHAIRRLFIPPQRFFLSLRDFSWY